MRTELGGKVTTARCDIRDGAAVDAMLDAVWRDAPLDILVNNAAATFIAQTEQLSFRAADAILAPTLHGTMYCTLGAGRRWIEGGHKGVVLSILSTSTITGRAFTVPSAMAKSAILAMTKSLAVEWGPRGIRTVAIAPGAFPTQGASGQLRPEGRDQGWASTNPLGRAGEHGERGVHMQRRSRHARLREQRKPQQQPGAQQKCDAAEPDDGGNLLRTEAERGIRSIANHTAAQRVQADVMADGVTHE